MTSVSKALLAGTALAIALAGGEAHAASANAGVSGAPGGNATMTAPGFATAEQSFSGGFAQANAYEFKAGIGASAFAAATGAAAFRTVIARASASLVDSFLIPDTEFLDEVPGGYFLLNFRIRADGSTSSSSTLLPSNPAFQSQTASKYTYSWTTGAVSGSGHHQSDKLLNAARPPIEIHEDSFKGGTLLVRGGEVVHTRFTAFVEAGAFSLPDAPGNAATDFSHTLAWGGITGISAFDGAGNALALPDGFRLSLLSSTSGFNYWNAAGRNPFTSGAVPEPATWAMMILGFGAAGTVLRARRRQASHA